MGIMSKMGIWHSGISFLLLLLVGYAALLLIVYFNQAGMLFLPNYGGASSRATPANAELDFEAVALIAEDGVQLDAWYVPATNERGVILFCHGNAGTIANRLSTLTIFNELDFSSLIFDYRGYGRSGGKPTEAGTYRDAEAAWQYLRDKGYGEDEIVIMGRSLGAAVAAELAHRHHPGAVVLESAFTSVPDAAAEVYPFLPVRWLSRFRYETIHYLQSITAPVLIVHSRDDEIISFAHGQRLFEAANSPKQFLELKGGHNDGIYVSGVDYYQDGLNNFFQRYVDRP